jgi:hypothetical protein
MARIPKGFRNNININPGKIGVERRQEILEDIADHGTFLPRGVSEEDMDETFVDFVKNELSITVDGDKVPVLFLTIQRWSEFTKTWQFSDKYKDIQLPFITIVRKPDIQVGQNQAGLYNIPGNRTYTYMKVPTWDGIREGMDLYKVPQPTSVDLSYDVRLFTNRTRDINKLNSLIQRKFQSRQAYINVKGHPMPVHLENITDESNIDDFENRRFYVQLFEMKLLGYLLDEEDFEVIPTINRTYGFFELVEDKLMKNVIFEPVSDINGVTFTIVFKPESTNSFTFIAAYDVYFTKLLNIQNISRITIFINNQGVFDGLIMNTPIKISANDNIMIRVYKNYYNTGKFELIGNTI